MLVLENTLSKHFEEYSSQVVGRDYVFESVHGKKTLLYADWMASGRLYEPIEHKMIELIGPLIANPHSFSSETGKATTYSYKKAREVIKAHVNANADDVLVTAGTGMTDVLARLQRVMGLRKGRQLLLEHERPVVFITHMEHHSNHVPWMETNADVVIIPPGKDNLVCTIKLKEELEKHKNRPLLIGAFTACSNVTGIITPYHELARLMHEHGGYCFVDFAASAPYVEIDMHPEEEAERLDAIYFSPHKFLGGPGACGVLVFDKNLYNASIPDVPGGGNVKWTTPLGAFDYFDDIECKEDGGTPGFLQTIRAALAIKLKEKMDPNLMAIREKEILKRCFAGLNEVPGLFILGSTEVDRIGCVSFGIEGIHYNLIVRLLNDRFGIQVRGGWSCASTYAHYLFNISERRSRSIIEGINQRNLTEKPGWVRISLHPTTTDAEVVRITSAIKEIAENIVEWGKDYKYNPQTNEFEHSAGDEQLIEEVASLFA